MHPSLYAPEVYDTCLRRIDAVTEETRPQWGSMSAAQMLSHCAEIQEVSNGKDLVGTPLIVRLFMPAASQMNWFLTRTCLWQHFRAMTKSIEVKLSLITIAWTASI